MAEAAITENFDVNIEKLFNVITDYDGYPEFVDACSKSEQVSREGDKIHVRYAISLIKDITYLLEHREDKDSWSMEWSLLESDFLKKNNGHWKLTQVSDNETRVDYAIDIEFKIPVPGLILKKLIKGSLPNMMKNFRERARNYG